MLETTKLANTSSDENNWESFKSCLGKGRRETKTSSSSELFWCSNCKGKVLTFRIDLSVLLCDGSQIRRTLCTPSQHTPASPPHPCFHLSQTFPGPQAPGINMSIGVPSQRTNLCFLSERLPEAW